MTPEERAEFERLCSRYVAPDADWTDRHESRYCELYLLFDKERDEMHRALPWGNMDTILKDKIIICVPKG